MKKILFVPSVDSAILARKTKRLLLVILMAVFQSAFAQPTAATLTPKAGHLPSKW